MNQYLLEQYKNLGLSEKVIEFGEKIEAGLKSRFEQIDAVAEFNQLKVLNAMQKNRVSAECFNQSSGYGYNDMGRDTLEKVYATSNSLEYRLNFEDNSEVTEATIRILDSSYTVKKEDKKTTILLVE